MGIAGLETHGALNALARREVLQTIIAVGAGDAIALAGPVFRDEAIGAD